MFRQCPIYGDLNLEEALFTYESVPIVFTCVNNIGTRCIVIYTDSIFKPSWIITEISDNILMDVLHNKISVCDAFNIGNNDVVIAEYKSELEYTCKKFSDIDSSELPDVNEKLDLDDVEYSRLKSTFFGNQLGENQGES